MLFIACQAQIKRGKVVFGLLASKDYCLQEFLSWDKWWQVHSFAARCTFCSVIEGFPTVVHTSFLFHTSKFSLILSVQNLFKNIIFAFFDMHEMFACLFNDQCQPVCPSIYVKDLDTGIFLEITNHWKLQLTLMTPHIDFYLLVPHLVTWIHFQDHRT